MLDVHIDDFYRDCAVILLHGFRLFPRTCTLFIEDISGPDDVDEYGLHSQRHMAAIGALHWLKDEGFVRFGAQDRQESVDDFVLGSKAFSRLVKPSLDDGNTLLQSIEYARLQGDSILLEKLMQQFLLASD